MTTKSKLLFSFVLAAIMFLVGFVPEFLQKREIQKELTAAREQSTQLENQLKVAEVRDLSGQMLLETLRRNYGSASDYSARYFDKIREITQAETAQTGSGLAELLNNREAVTTALAQGDASSLSTVQSLVERTYELTRKR
jgi:hypothetical protein